MEDLDPTTEAAAQMMAIIRRLVRSEQIKLLRIFLEEGYLSPKGTAFALMNIENLEHHAALDPLWLRMPSMSDEEFDRLAASRSRKKAKPR